MKKKTPKYKANDKLIATIVGIVAGSYIGKIAEDAIRDAVKKVISREAVLREVYQWLEDEYIGDKRMNFVHSAFYDKFLKQYEKKDKIKRGELKC